MSSSGRVQGRAVALAAGLTASAGGVASGILVPFVIQGLDTDRVPGGLAFAGVGLAWILLVVGLAACSVVEPTPGAIASVGTYLMLFGLVAAPVLMFFYVFALALVALGSLLFGFEALRAGTIPRLAAALFAAAGVLGIGLGVIAGPVLHSDLLLPTIEGFVALFAAAVAVRGVLLLIRLRSA